MNQIKIQVLKETEMYENGFPPDNAIEFLNWLKDKINSVPENHKNLIQIEWGSAYNYGDSETPTIEMYYFRDKTTEELEQENFKKQGNEHRARLQKLAQFNELKKEFDT